MWDHFQLSGVCPGAFEFLHLPIKLPSLGSGLADRAIVRPRHMARHQPEVPHHGNPLVGHRLNDLRAGGAVDRAGANLQCGERDSDRLLIGGQTVRRGAGDETIRCRGHDLRQARLRLGRVETAAHQIHACLRCGRCLLGRLDVNVCEAAFSLELLQVVNRVLLPWPEHRGKFAGARPRRNQKQARQSAGWHGPTGRVKFCTPYFDDRFTSNNRVPVRRAAVLDCGSVGLCTRHPAAALRRLLQLPRPRCQGAQGRPAARRSRSRT